jgi:2-keto-3-deoxy-L-rhamnonate aldolase RhmA
MKYIAAPNNLLAIVIVSIFHFSTVSFSLSTTVDLGNISHQNQPPMSLRQHLLKGGKSYGPLFMSDSTVVMELLALSGYGHIVIDHEHSATDVRRTRLLLQAMESSLQSISRASDTNHQRRTEPIIRLPGPNDAVYMKKVLDTLRLPAGVLVPMVEDVASARAVVEATRYPLSIGSDGNGGTRGCAIPFIRATSYGRVERETYLQQCQNDLLVMVQVESPKAIDAIPDIAQMDGIDAIFLGPLDLSASIGKVYYVMVAYSLDSDHQINPFNPCFKEATALFAGPWILAYSKMRHTLMQRRAMMQYKKVWHDAIVRIDKSIIVFAKCTSPDRK